MNFESLRIHVCVLTMLTWACLFGSKRNKQPTWCDCVWIIPAHTMLSGFGSMPSSSCIPKPESFVLAPDKSSGSCALNTFCARCFSLKFIFVMQTTRKMQILIKTHPPRFFHRAKNDSPFISVGSKNLLSVNGSLMMNFCGVPL